MYSLIPVLIVSLAVAGFMYFTGSVEGEIYKKYSLLVKVVSIIACLGVIVFGVVLQFYSETDSININWVLCGSFGLIMIVSMLFD